VSTFQGWVAMIAFSAVLAMIGWTAARATTAQGAMKEMTAFLEGLAMIGSTAALATIG
jgi:hypothetical protein